jgi:hypothetical protein
MQPEEREVPTGALAAALDIVEALHGRDGGMPPPQVIDEVIHDLKIWGHSTVTEAFGSIIYVAAQQLRWRSDDPDATGLKMRIVSAVVTRLQRDIPEVPVKHLPTVAGILTAAFLEIGPVEWRTAHGPVEPDEHLAWCYTAWFMVDFVDTAMERPGGFQGRAQLGHVTGWRRSRKSKVAATVPA